MAPTPTPIAVKRRPLCPFVKFEIVTNAILNSIRSTRVRTCHFSTALLPTNAQLWFVTSVYWLLIRLIHYDNWCWRLIDFKCWRFSTNKAAFTPVTRAWYSVGSSVNTPNRPHKTKPLAPGKRNLTFAKYNCSCERFFPREIYRWTWQPPKCYLEILNHKIIFLRERRTSWSVHHGRKLQCDNISL